MTSKAKNGAYNILAMLKDTVKRIIGIIMPEAIDNLKNKNGRIFTIRKASNFDKGQC